MAVLDRRKILSQKIIVIFIIIITLEFSSCATIVKGFYRSYAVTDQMILHSQHLSNYIIEYIDIPYINDGKKEHTLDVYMPNVENRVLPVIINIHGGGFVYGDKSLRKPYCYYLAEKGYVVYNINYRLSFSENSGVKLPEQINDVVSALNWIYDNLDIYGGDKNRVFITGDSVGAYLAVVSTLLSVSKEFQQEMNMVEVKFTINGLGLSGGFFILEDRSIPSSIIRRIIFNGIPYEERKKYYIDNIVWIEKLPPVFMTTNYKDEFDYMSKFFEKILIDNNVEYKLIYLTERGKKLGHIFNVKQIDWIESQELNNKMLEYFSLL